MYKIFSYFSNNYDLPNPTGTMSKTVEPLCKCHSHISGRHRIRRFCGNIKQFHRLVTFENATTRWGLVHCKQKLPRRRRRVKKQRGAVGVPPRDSASTITRHCDGSSATAKPPGDGLAAAMQPSRDGAHGVCIKGSTYAFQMHNR